MEGGPPTEVAVQKAVKKDFGPRRAVKAVGNFLSRLKPTDTGLKTPNLVSRRNFLKGVAGLGIAAAVGSSVNSQPSPDANPQGVAASSTPEPERAKQLYATATAVARKGESSSFVEAGGFDKEFFERVRRSAVLIMTQNGNDLVRCTGFFIGKEGEYSYFVSAKHSFDDNQESGKVDFITIRRPEQNNLEFVPDEANVAFLDQDVALVKCKGDHPITNPTLEGLNYLDDYKPKIGKQQLMVGFPHEFQSKEMHGKYIILGSVLKVGQVNHDPSHAGWLLNGINDSGSSGSPVVIKGENGMPLVVGVVSGGGNERISCNSLNINKLKSLQAS